MEIRNGRIRMTPEEAADPKYFAIRHKLVEPPPPWRDGYLYLITNVMDLDPWFEFNQGPAPRRPERQAPATFTELYGARPAGDLGLAGLWDQQLSLWQDNLPPDWASPEEIVGATLVFQAHGMGVLKPYRLTNGAEFVCFPEANLAGRRASLPLYYELPAKLVYELSEHGIAIYQLAAQQEGHLISPDQLVPIADGRRRIHRIGTAEK